MAQTEPINWALGAARTGQAIGSIIYQLDGTTVISAFDVTGWYEKPTGTGKFNHPGLILPDVGATIAIGVSGVEYDRVSVGAAKLLATNYTAPTTPPTAAAIRTEMDANSTQLAKLGVPVGTIASDIAGVQADTDDLQTRIGTAGIGLTALASAANLATVNTNVNTINTKIGTPVATVSTDIAAVKTDTAAVKLKTDNLPVDPASASVIAGAFSSIASTLATIAGYIDTEVAAIKAKTDALPASPAATGDIPTAVAIRIEMDANSTKLIALTTSVATLITNVAAILSDTGTDGVALSTAVQQAIADIVNGRGGSHLDGIAEKYSNYHLIQAILNGETIGGFWTPYTAGSNAAIPALAVPYDTDENALPLIGTHGA